MSTTCAACRVRPAGADGSACQACRTIHALQRLVHSNSLPEWSDQFTTQVLRTAFLTLDLCANGPPQQAPDQVVAGASPVTPPETHQRDRRSRSRSRSRSHHADFVIARASPLRRRCHRESRRRCTPQRQLSGGADNVTAQAPSTRSKADEPTERSTGMHQQFLLPAGMPPRRRRAAGNSCIFTPDAGDVRKKWSGGRAFLILSCVSVRLQLQCRDAPHYPPNPAGAPLGPVSGIRTLDAASARLRTLRTGGQRSGARGAGTPGHWAGGSLSARDWPIAGVLLRLFRCRHRRLYDASVPCTRQFTHAGLHSDSG